MDAQILDPRQHRGLVLAQTKRIKALPGGKWVVPSQTGRGTYVVDVEERSCQCEDHQLRLVKCKHLWAISYARHQVVALDGTTTTTETMKVSYTPREGWAAYNAYQMSEKDKVRALLHGLCSGIHTPPQVGRGRPRIPLSDIVYSGIIRVFTGFSGRRATTDMADCLALGHLSRVPAYNTVFDHFADSALTPLLETLVQESAAPIADIDIERAYGVDASGFTTDLTRKWFDHKYPKKEGKKDGKEGEKIEAESRENVEAIWKKLHIAIGCRSKIICAAIVTEGSSNDNPFLPRLMKETGRRFTVANVLADKGYHGLPNLTEIDKLVSVGRTSATPYIPFKSNSIGDGPEIWRKAFHLFAFHRQTFLAQYTQREGVEGVFSALKRKFSSALRSRTDDSLVNELLTKCVCHNLSVVVRTIHELGIEPMFWQGPVRSLAVEELQ